MSLSLTAAGSAFLSGTTLYYKGNESTAGNRTFRFRAAVSDGTSGPASATFPDISATGWTHANQTVATPSGGPYDSNAFTWTQNPSNPSGYSISAADQAGNTASQAVTYTVDNTAPTGGAVSVNGTPGTGGGSTSTTSSTSFPINSRTDYNSDNGSGVASSILTVQSETLTAGTCGGPGSGGPFTSPTTISGTTQPSGIQTGFCYLYTLTGTDKVGNTVSIKTTVSVSTSPTITFPTSSGQETVKHNTCATFTITGTGFKNGAAVTISGGFTINKVTFVDSSHITVNVTAGNGDDKGTYNLTVANPDGGSITSLNSMVNS
jgi:hypothetical protein